jgi:hypothetical protein
LTVLEVLVECGEAKGKHASKSPFQSGRSCMFVQRQSAEKSLSRNIGWSMNIFEFCHV